ncbi:MAG: aldo/keto reductase [Ardenticatenaceae bacterium]|nr:aldo/keto reductase [Ardenticatenaceae bacterium]HBY94441.1 aldo/keto reductase [Chloroflexota bacterium]
MISRQPFGRTGHLSARALLGAAAFGRVTQSEADAALERALGYGVNHVDTAASYGESEQRLGSWIRRHGRPFFLATKTGERIAQRAREELHRSLERLGVHQVDLLQLHNLVDPREWETALGPGGALEAAIAAREEGLVRFIGVTGHGWTVARMHARALERFDFDSVLLPWSYVLAQNAQYRADFQALVQVCHARQVAVQTIKAIVRAPWDDRPPTRVTWYEPLEEQADIDLAIHWVLGHPGLFVNTVGDIHVLPKVLEAASRFEAAPADSEMQAQVARLGMRALFP